MFKNYLLIFLRNIARNKTFSVLNVGGFALGMAACLLILLFVSHEKSFDRFHTKAERIYRLNEWQRFEGMQEQHVALSMFPMGPTLIKDHPEIEAYVRIESKETAVIRNSSKELSKHHLLYVDSTFYQVFDFPVINGDKNSVLFSPTNIAITASVAKKLFGTTDALGKIVEIKSGDEFISYNVGLVMEDVPSNSHLRFEMILPMSALKKQPWMDGWDSNWVNTYLLLKDNADVATLTAALPAFEKKYLGKDDKFYDLVLQPFLQIHLGSEGITHDGMNYKKFSEGHIRTFIILAIAVLLIAVFNFINLSTALAIKRTKEVGIRKTIGAGRGQLIHQFTSEAILFAFISFGIAMMITTASLPLINSLFERDIKLDFVKNVYTWLLVMGAVTLVGILSGLYPAFIIAAYKPVTMVKGGANIHSKKRISLRHVLVVSQFVIAVGLIVSTIIITQQLQYALHKETGFNKDHIVLVPMNATANKKKEAIRNELLSSNYITDLTAYNERLGANINQWGASYISAKGEKKGVSVSHLYVDHNYIDFFGIKMAEGRNFSLDHGDTSGRAYIINEALAREMDTKQPVGTQYKGNWLDEMGTIVGVAKDFNFNSIHHKIAPLFFSVQNWDFSEMAIRIKEGNTTSALAAIENIWRKHVPDMPYEYSFLDEHMDKLYKSDLQAGRVVKIAMLLSILVACLGLFGMALYTIETRVKEIGIRKVLGASLSNIAITVSRDFVKLVLIAAIIALPIAWIAMNKWLQDFAFRINISWWVFIMAILASLVIALCTVGFQAIRAARANPVKSLRSE